MCATPLVCSSWWNLEISISVSRTRNSVVETWLSKPLRHGRIVSSAVETWVLNHSSSYFASVAEWFNDQISTTESRVRLPEMIFSRFHHVLPKMCLAFSCLRQLLRKGIRVFTQTLVTIVVETVITEIFFLVPGRKYHFSNWLLCREEL